jgi:hypothetical protein
MNICQMKIYPVRNNAPLEFLTGFTSSAETPTTYRLPLADCVTISEMVKNVMLNLFQHLIKSIGYETLK